eukprot:850181_1
MIKSLVTLIECEQKCKMSDGTDKEIQVPKDMKNSKYITQYGMNLFHYFCTNSDTTKIEIKNFKSLPLEIRNALLTSKGNTKQISFVPITHLFKCLQEVTLTDLNNSQFTKESKHYVDVVMQYIQNHDASSLEKRDANSLRKITFQSERQRDRKTNTTLKKLANYNLNKFKRLKWKIEYDFREYDTHILVFTKLD